MTETPHLSALRCAGPVSVGPSVREQISQGLDPASHRGFHERSAQLGRRASMLASSGGDRTRKSFLLTRCQLRRRRARVRVCVCGRAFPRVTADRYIPIRRQPADGRHAGGRKQTDPADRGSRGENPPSCPTACGARLTGVFTSALKCIKATRNSLYYKCKVGGGDVCVRDVSLNIFHLYLFLSFYPHILLFIEAVFLWCGIWKDSHGLVCLFVCCILVVSNLFFFFVPIRRDGDASKTQAIRSRVPPKKSPRLICEPFFFCFVLKGDNEFLRVRYRSANNRLLSSLLFTYAARRRWCG